MKLFSILNEQEWIFNELKRENKKSIIQPCATKVEGTENISWKIKKKLEGKVVIKN